MLLVLKLSIYCIYTAPYSNEIKWEKFTSHTNKLCKYFVIIFLRLLFIMSAPSANNIETRFTQRKQLYAADFKNVLIERLAHWENISTCVLNKMKQIELSQSIRM